ncbi:hypothetical protein EYF80_040981 [Liparis tanakae]|uniref:Uncharacterized protein n=1 Tax=Liparis tanakae TaxID=230148 RepID=A0A4Z2G5F1_9TELE|nr:hypothetical protein EYF80_040981 [Liparis tanakae]
MNQHQGVNRTWTEVTWVRILFSGRRSPGESTVLWTEVTWVRVLFSGPRSPGLALRSMLTVCLEPSRAFSMASADMRTLFRAGFFTPPRSTTLILRS